MVNKRAVGEQAFGSSRGKTRALGVGLGREDGYCFHPLPQAGQGWQRPERAESHLCSCNIPGTACPPWSPKANWTKQPVQEKTAGQNGFLSPALGGHSWWQFYKSTKCVNRSFQSVGLSTQGS